VFYTNASVCDGIPDCYDRQDECGVGCANESHFCDSDISCHKVQLTEIWEKYGLLFLNKREYCDGRPLKKDPCPLGFDETNCTDRYYCNIPTKYRFSVDQSLLCDGVLDCEDGSDEWESVCNESRFYCNNKTPLSVAREQVENGIRDCSDGSDECPADSKKKSVFSSPFEMIGNPIFRVILWIMGGLSFVGNIGVTVIGILHIRETKNEPLKLAFLWLLVNLSISDSIMGIYLLSVSAMGKTFSGRYCYHDTDWRSSSACSVLGSMSIISSEVSALTMTTMATIRLFSVYFPMKMSSILRRTYVVPMIFCWCVGILLGTLPLANYRSGYFIKAVWYPNYFFTRQEILKSDVVWIAQRAGHFTGNVTTSMDWFDVKDTMTRTFQELEIKGEFGYFGETSVCLPRLFVKVGDTAWEYSTFIIVLNFCLFVYMAISYIALYQRSRKVTKAGKNKSNKLLQTVFLMIVSNLCCWIPICIMAFVNLSGVELDSIVYIVCAGVLLPINSVMNPLIYSDVAVNLVRK
uniref:G-protein coupled receptors family 1 profile domain-containing protein n=1 Tax=Ciona savignyi TaxID=51511 RepID=H2YML7_CIOSA